MGLEGRFCWREKQVNRWERGGDPASSARESGFNGTFQSLHCPENRAGRKAAIDIKKEKKKKRENKIRGKCPPFSDKSDGCFFVCLFRSVNTSVGDKQTPGYNIVSLLHRGT